MVHRGMERCATSSATSEILIKTLTRYHYTPVGAAKISKSDPPKCRGNCEPAGTTIFCWWGWKMIRTFGKRFGGFLKSYTYTYSCAIRHSAPGY